MTGLSFKTGQKMVNFVVDAGLEKDPYGFNTVRMIKKMQLYYTGVWQEDMDQQKVIDHGIQKGNFWDTEIYLTYCGLVYIELGDHYGFLEMKDKLFDLADSFDDSHSGSQAYRIASVGYIKFRKFDEFLTIVKDGRKYIEDTENVAMLVVFNAMMAQLYIYLNDLKNAKKALAEAEKWKTRIMNIPVYFTQILLARIKLDFEKIKSLSKTDQHFRLIIKELKTNSDKLIAKSKKLIANLTEAYLLKAKLDQLLKKNQKAFKYLHLAIQTGEKYNGRLELSRAYFETGKFLSDPNVKYKELNGEPASHYLEKAKTMFEEMDLQWDLEEYQKFMNQL